MHAFCSCVLTKSTAKAKQSLLHWPNATRVQIKHPR